MNRNGARYNLYSDYLKHRYGAKVYKLPVNLPVTCPNRDGTCGTGGCDFCGEEGAGHESLPADMPVRDQVAINKSYIGPRYKAEKFIVYFQNYTNTYLPPRLLRSYIEEACLDDVVAVHVATRPDCISDAHVMAMEEARLAKGVDITVELGLQTVNYRTLAAIHRGHTLAEFIDAVVRIRRLSRLSVCVHLIPNLPGDDILDTVETAKVLSAFPVEQVKLHALFIVKGTRLAEEYASGQLKLGTLDDYVERVIAFLEHLHPETVVQRLVGRAPASATVFANWGVAWWRIRDLIEAGLAERDTWQGKRCDYLNGRAVKKFGTL